jgi:hypothetical protein
MAATIEVTFDSEKLSALRQYATKKDLSVEVELADAAEKLYEKLVPSAIRDYLANKLPSAAPARTSRTVARSGAAVEGV